MARFHIIYSSVGGNTQLVVNAVAQTLSLLGHTVLFERCEQSNVQQIKEHDCFILAAPTYGHGEPDQRFMKFLQEHDEFDFAHHPCTLIGLGDSKYDDDYNLAIIPTIMNFLRKRNAKMVHFPLGIDKSPIPHIESRIIPWAEELGSLFPLEK